MRKLAHIAEFPLPAEHFGGSLMRQALDSFEGGDVEAALTKFEWMLRHHPTDEVRNNIAYCKAVQGRYDEAVEQLKQMRMSRDDPSWPIWQHNRGVLAFVTGDADAGRSSLMEARAWILTADPTYDRRWALCMLLLGPAGQVVSRTGLPVDAAILLNLYVMNGLTRDEMRRELGQRYPDEVGAWLEWIGE
jgi:hypothetical protein